ncbi:DUF6443 domain-containing protein, partial [Soonwooa purpurea]
MKKNRFILFALLFGSVASKAQTIPSADQNYVFSTVFLDENKTKKQETIQYMDGLGRPKQIINVKASPSQNDIVTQITYDNLGRQDKDYLPMPQQSSTNGAFYGGVSEIVGSPLYGGVAPFYAQKEIEKSPLERPLSTTAPGAWANSNKKISFNYSANTSSEVRKYSATTISWSNGVTNSQLTHNASYAANQLYKTITTDEDGNVVTEFKDKQGKVILVKRYVNKVSAADTYYVYNEYQQLVYVITPNAVAKGVVLQADLDDLCYQYNYDAKGRLAEKKLPGKGWEYFVYDNQDRLVLSQDVNMGSKQQWLFNKYDKYGRITYTGLYTSSSVYSSAGRNAEQNVVNTKGSNNVERKASAFTQPGLSVYYDNDASKNYPNAITKLLSVNYYDTYPLGTPDHGTTVLDQALLTQDAQTNIISTKSLPTANFVNNVEANGWTKNYMRYDTKGQLVKNHTLNHLGGYTITESKLDFTGSPVKTKTYHKRRNTDVELIVEQDFEYDLQNRLEKQYHWVVGKSLKELLVFNHYNEIGQLDNKDVGGVLGQNLQNVKYSYNVRGWLTGINKDNIIVGNEASYIPSGLTNGKLFGYNIKYNNPESSLSPGSFNGNISEVDWIYNNGSDMLHRYSYAYDKSSRLISGNYQRPDLTVPVALTNDEYITYDLNGNIINLQRTTSPIKGNTPLLIDDLTYNYSGNKVTNIQDASANSLGYPGGGQTISYDNNGNMTSMPDKGISKIDYNYLNLPTEILQNNNKTNYYYRADGTKIKKQYNLVNATGTKIINTEYLDGFQYSTPNTMPIRRALEETDTATLLATTAGQPETFALDTERVLVPIDPGGGSADDVVLSFFPTAEGYYDYENLRYIYQYKDHLGNVRLSYTKDGGTTKIVDTNDYYPFGLSFIKRDGNLPVFDPLSIPYNYKYNGMELQESGMYDYGARFYMPDIGRWG